MHAQNAGNGAAMPAERPKPKKKTKKLRRRMWSGRQPMAVRRRAAKSLGVLETGNIARIRADAEAAMAAAQQSNARLREAIDILPQGIVFLDAEGRYILWNEKYAEIYEKSADQFKPGARLEDALRVGVARGDYPDAAGREEEWIAERLAKLHHPGLRHEQMLSDGRCILIEDRLTGDGGVIGLRVDITELKQRESSFRLLFDSNPVPMIVCAQEDGCILSANDAAVAHYGYSRTDFEKLKISDVQAFEQATPWTVEQTTEERAARTWKHVKADGSLIDVAIYSRLLVFEGRRAVLLALMDITERKRAEARLAFMAQHDGLTGLPNRILLRQRLDELLAHTRRTGDKVAVMFLDLDNFKTINDTLGHAAGDKLLKGVTRRLRSSLREDDAVARLGSDEFAIVQAGISRPEEVAQLARRLIHTISEPYLFDGHTIVSGASIGIAIAPGDGDDAEKLLKNADMALSRAKSEGLGTFSFFEAEMDARAQSRRRIEIELRAAIEANVLQPYYQPLIDLTNGRITGLEALVRWPHRERGMVSPAEFIPVAEETGLIRPLGEWVLRTACAQFRTWMDAGHPHLRLAVNLSTRQFEQRDLAACVGNILAETGFPAENLELEITESAIMIQGEQARDTLEQLKRLGVSLAIDDFGTGYSSLAYLKRFAVDRLKIDQSFIRDLLHSDHDREIAATIIAMARHLKLSVLAEGVESEAQLDFLHRHGCDAFQGYLSSPPLAAADFTAFLERPPKG